MNVNTILIAHQISNKIICILYNTYTQHWEIMDNMFERFLIVLLCVMPFDNLVLMLFILFTYVVFWPDGGEQKMIFRS
jgi:hypothetical protein